MEFHPQNLRFTLQLAASFDSGTIYATTEVMRAPGFSLAALASGMLVTAGVIAIATLSYLAVLAGDGRGFEQALRDLLAVGAFSLIIYLVWALTIFGTAGSIVALAIYQFRERWFWRCLFLASTLFLLFPPIHTLLGIFSLVLLIRFRRTFDGNIVKSTEAFNNTEAYKEAHI